MTGKQLKACVALILAVLILPGCQATRAHSPTGPAPVQLVASGGAIGVGAPTRRPSHPAQSYQTTGCMGFGLGGGDKAGLVVVLVLLAPIFFLGGLLGIFG